MALFGEKCIRCGKRRTKHTYEGLPTCEDCEANLLTQAKAAVTFHYSGDRVLTLFFSAQYGFLLYNSF